MFDDFRPLPPFGEEELDERVEEGRLAALERLGEELGRLTLPRLREGLGEGARTDERPEGAERTDERPEGAGRATELSRDGLGDEMRVRGEGSRRSVALGSESRRGTSRAPPIRSMTRRGIGAESPEDALESVPRGEGEEEPSRH